MCSAANNKRYNFFGMPVDALTCDEALMRVLDIGAGAALAGFENSVF